jgi:hypothetical protein
MGLRHAGGARPGSGRHVDRSPATPGVDLVPYGTRRRVTTPARRVSATPPPPRRPPAGPTRPAAAVTPCRQKPPTGSQVVPDGQHDRHERSFSGAVAMQGV